MLSQPLASGTPDLKCSSSFCASAVTVCNVGCRQDHLADVCITCPSCKGERDVSKGSALCKEHGYKTRSQTQTGKTSILAQRFLGCTVPLKVIFFCCGVWISEFSLGFLFVLLPLWYFSPYKYLFGICSLPWASLFHGTCMTCLSAICRQNDAKIRKRTESHITLTDPGEVWVQMEMCGNLDHT